MEFLWVFVLELGISKGCRTIWQNFQGWQLVFSGISKGKVTNLKTPESFFRKVYPQTLFWTFSGIAHLIQIQVTKQMMQRNERSHHCIHCVKSVQIWSYFWSVFSCIWNEYGGLLHKSPYSVRIQEMRTTKKSIFGHF